MKNGVCLGHSVQEIVRIGYQRAGYSPSERLLIAVSGGADSVALLHATLCCWPNDQTSFEVVHVNHGLRGLESCADEEFVRNLANRERVACHVLHITGNELRAMPHRSLEEAARQKRYELLAGLAQTLGVRFVATAHHQDDQAETVLHNILRGTGTRGLAGMKFARPLNNSLTLIRPALELSRQQILRYVHEQSLSFREDSSNADADHTRNRIRNELLPCLRDTINPRVDQNLINLAEQASEITDLLDELAAAFLNHAVLEVQPEMVRLKRAECRCVQPVVLRHALVLLWVQLNWSRQRMTRRHWHVLAEAAAGQGTARGTLPRGVSFTADRDVIRIHRVHEPR